MAGFVNGPVSVSVPATSANLGPGFDCLGLALELRDTLVGQVTSGGLAVGVRGEGVDEVPRDESHLVVRAMRAAFDAMGVQPAGLELSCRNVVPHGRGLGSSAAAIVGGITLARALVADDGRRLDEMGTLALANSLEGHPDNVAAALLGGLVVSGQREGEVWAVSAPIDPSVGMVAFVPSQRVSTEVTRALLPVSVPHADATANSGLAALLVTALGGATDQLLRATDDTLHQPYREPAMPESLRLVRTLRAAGLPAFVSGAGPSVLTFTLAGASADALAHCPDGWAARELAVAVDGSRVE
ncbi:MAG: homoserine kinase [Actinomycetota bacterium]|nr:homoserine kinase [Actinomycetota bacterium]